MPFLGRSIILYVELVVHCGLSVALQQLLISSTSKHTFLFVLFRTTSLTLSVKPSVLYIAVICMNSYWRAIQCKHAGFVNQVKIVTF